MRNNALYDKRAIVVGTGTVAFQCAKELKAHSVPVEVIEYMQASVSSLSALCSKADIPFCNLSKERITEYLLQINERCLIISAFNQYLFPSVVVSKDNLQIINYHNALLPQYAGRNAEAWVIFEQERETGITWHFVDCSIDGGDILCQRKIMLNENMTSLKLLKIQHEAAIVSFKEMLPQLLSGTLAGYLQEKSESHIIYHSAWIPGQGRLDTNWNMNKMHAFLRAMDYGPLKILGVPQIEYGNDVYTWKRYKVNVVQTQAEKEIFYRDKDIVIQDSKMEIILFDVYKMSEGIG